MTQTDGIVGEYFELHEEADADLLAMQMGDFYEFFADDAEIVGEELDLKTSHRSSGGESYLMAGVPVDDLTPHLTALVERGYRVAVADQHETDDGHTREISRIVSPGTLIESTDASARYLATVVEEEQYGVALADVTTGKFFISHVEDDRSELLSELYRFSPVEVLPGPEIRNDDVMISKFREELDTTINIYETAAFASGSATHAVHNHFGDGALESVNVDASSPAVRAAGAALEYINETGPGVLASFTRLQRLRDSESVALDATTQRNLELTETLRGDQSGSLLDTIDHTVTSAGRRKLREWLVRPTRNVDELNSRLNSITALSQAALARDQLTDELDACYDLARISSKATHGSADPTDLVRIRETLSLLPSIISIITDTERLATSPVSTLFIDIDDSQINSLYDKLDSALTDDPPKSISDGGIIARGYHEELDTLLSEYESHQRWIENLDDQVKRNYGLTHVTVDRNKTDGYYIQIGKSEADEAPDHFDEIKTLKNSKRFVTEELQERERSILRLEEQRSEIERELFENLKTTIANHADLLQTIGEKLARLDALSSLTTHAVQYRWARPEIEPPGEEIHIDQGRHPVVETTTEFVPNDTRLNSDNQFLIVTGPNMSGKSTYMRQTALIVLLAQIGSFVPANDARIGLVDGIYTRVGALDELAQGRSTFMVEMQELSNILHSASEDSLIILDEVGRGTATYDGISIAWSTTEYLHNQIEAKTLFATHYHELTSLADHLDRVSNVHVAAEETNGDVTFLRTIRDGPTNRSYGIHVADLAGVPDPVVSRARTVLDRLRNEKAIQAKGSPDSSTQVVFDLETGSLKGTQGSSSEDNAQLSEQFGDDAESVLTELSDLDVAQTSPVELMSIIQSWQEMLD